MLTLARLVRSDDRSAQAVHDVCATVGVNEDPAVVRPTIGPDIYDRNPAELPDGRGMRVALEKGCRIVELLLYQEDRKRRRRGRAEFLVRL